MNKTEMQTLCPYRKTKYWEAIDSQSTYNALVITKTKESERFEDCLKEKCMAYFNGKCTLCK